MNRSCNGRTFMVTESSRKGICPMLDVVEAWWLGARRGRNIVLRMAAGGLASPCKVALRRDYMSMVRSIVRRDVRARVMRHQAKSKATRFPALAQAGRKVDKLSKDERGRVKRSKILTESKYANDYGPYPGSYEPASNIAKQKG